MWSKAQDAFGRSDFKTAIGSLRLISNIDANDHCAKLNLATALASAGDAAGALAQLDAIVETWGDDAEFHVTRANVLLALQRRDDAIGALADALERDATHRPALDLLKQLGVLAAIYEDPRDAASLVYVRADSLEQHLAAVWGTAPRDISYFLQQIAYHELERRPAVALAAAERAIALGGDAPHPRAVSARALALRDLGRKEEAIAAARAEVERTGSAAARVDLARCLLAAGEDARATEELDRALGLDPGDLMALDLRYWPAERHDLEQVQDASAKIEAHANAHPSAAGAWRVLARARLAIGDAAGALGLFAKAVGLAPEDDDLRAEWWGELVRHHHAQAVLDDAAALAEITKHDWKLRWNEAEALAAAGRKMEAQAAFAAINRDETLHVDVRKRAKRAALGVAEAK
jgi:tetratricopeptide (TPR) repeat protein